MSGKAFGPSSGSRQSSGRERSEMVRIMSSSCIKRASAYYQVRKFSSRTLPKLPALPAFQSKTRMPENTGLDREREKRTGRERERENKITHEYEYASNQPEQRRRGRLNARWVAPPFPAAKSSKAKQSKARERKRERERDRERARERERDVHVNSLEPLAGQISMRRMGTSSSFDVCNAKPRSG